ncbi:MAG: hypothetical protein MUO23_02500 [Anaerolineales bacterium]|nr:hypothetical protein [Anaerolineales bacterium]
MGGLLDQAIEQSMDSLIHRDLDLARQVAAADARINDLRYRIEEFCLATIAT